MDVFDNRGWSPLHEAAHNGFSGCLEYLLRQQDVDPDWMTHKDETPILLAARNGHYHCLRALINAKANVNIMTNEGFSPLYEAIMAKSNECIRLLIKKGAMVNHVVFTGYTPLHQAASMGNFQVTTYLLQQGAVQNVRCHNGLTPLFVAVQSGSVETVRALLNRQHEVDNANDDVVNIPAEDNATPLLIAAQEGRDEMIDMLLQHGANPNIQVTSIRAGPLQYAVYCNHPKCVRKLLPVTDLLMFDSDFGVMHPLVQALGHPDTAILQDLLEAGLNPMGSRPLDPEQVEDFQDMMDELVEADWKASLLCHLPREGGGLAAAHILLDRGLSPNVQQDKEVPPLLAAMARKNLPLVHLLLQKGANPNVYSSAQNITMLFALYCDLQGSEIGEAFELDGAAGDNAGKLMIVDNVDTHQWIESSKHSFLIPMFAAGGEVETLLRNGVLSSWNLHSVLQMNLAPYVLAKRQAVAAALLTLLLCLSYGVETLHQDLLSLVSVDQAKELNAVAEKCCTLAHMSRRFIFRSQCNRKQKLEDAIASFGLPEQVCDYLHFPELETHRHTLDKVFPAVLG